MRKLGARGIAAGIAQSVLDTLEAQGMPTSRRFAGEYVALRAPEGFGPSHIRARLSARGVTELQVRQALDEQRLCWTELCRTVLRAKRFGECLPAARDEWRRQARFLAQGRL